MKSVGRWRGAWGRGGRGRWRGVLGLVAVLVLGWLALAASRSGLEAPPPTLQLVDRHDRFLGEVPAPGDERLGYWPATVDGRLPERIVAATLAAEDRRFHAHPGVDPVAVARAVRQNLASGERISGASTIPMQVARLQRPGPRTWPRKALEATVAVLLVARHGREAVLAHYLRLAPYGNNVHGVAYAARRYLDKPVADLSWAEVAFLVALPQAPGRMNPYTREGRAAATARARRILDAMRESGAIGAEDWARAAEELEVLRIPDRPERPASALHAVLRLGDELGEARPAVPRVRTALDLAVQEAVVGRLRAGLDGLRARGAGNGAAVVVDRATGAVVAYAGSADWHDRSSAGAIDFAATPRSPGSTLKPFLYARALDAGRLGPVEVLADLRTGASPIDNADHDELGPLLPRRALANSRNVPAVELTLRLGVADAHGLLRELGLHDDGRPAAHYGTLVALGGLPVTLFDLVGAYGALANDGVWRPLRWVDVDGDDAAGGAGDARGGARVLSARSSRRVLGWLADPMARLPSFPRSGNLELPFPAAIKTGTAEDWRDAWAVGVTERYVVGVWVGHPDWRPMRGVSGYRAAGVLQGLLTDLHPGDAERVVRAFPPPEGAEAVEVCAWSGAAAGPACDEVSREWLLPDEVPHGPCPVHRVEGGRTVLALDGPMRSWALARGLPVAAGPEDGELDLQIVAPADGVTVLRDPEAPGGVGAIALRAAVDRDVPQVLWRVDGVEVALAEPPYTAWWPIAPGRHVIEAEAGGVRRRVRIEAR